MKTILFSIGLFIIWPLLEYYFHRIELHKEVNLTEDKTGEKYAALFKTHLCHHVYMKAKYRVSLGIDFTLAFTFALIYLAYLTIGLNSYLPVAAGTLQGGMIYDWIHYSFHHFEVKFGIGILDRHY